LQFLEHRKFDLPKAPVVYRRHRSTARLIGEPDMRTRCQDESGGLYVCMPGVLEVAPPPLPYIQRRARELRSLKYPEDSTGGHRTPTLSVDEASHYRLLALIEVDNSGQSRRQGV